MNTCVVIPSYNGAKSIGCLVRKLKLQNLDVVVIDDGSSDLTSKIAVEAGAITLRNNVNRGKGASLRKGFDYALRRGYDYIITMDGDGQHRPEDIPHFLKALRNNSPADMFIGNRMHQPLKMPWIRQITNKVMSCLISRICRQNIPDSQNGFRLIKSNTLKELELLCDRFEIETEMILKAARRGARIASIEITSIYENHSSLISPLADTLRFVRLILTDAVFLKCRVRNNDYEALPR